MSKIAIFFYEKFIKPKSESEDQRRREFILNILLLASIFLSGVAFIVGLYQTITLPEYRGLSLIAFAVIFFIFLALHFLSRAGFYIISAYIFIGTFFILTTYAIYKWGADLPAGLLFYILIIIMSGILISTRFSFLITFIASLTIFIIGYLQINNIIHPDLYGMKDRPPDISDVISVFIIFGIIATASWLSNREIEKSLKRVRRSEAVIKESEKRFRQFFENEPEYCYMISPEGKILNINVSALEALGYEKQEIIGKPFLTTIYAPSSRDKAKNLFVEWGKTGKLRDKELNIITKNEEERVILLSADAVRNAKGEIIHSISIQRDITDRKKAEEDLKESEEKYRTIMELSPEAILILNTKGFVTSINSTYEKITGYKGEEILGKHISKVPGIFAKNLPYYLKTFASSLLKRKLPEKVETSFKTKQGTISIIEARPAFMKKENKIIGVQVILIDITERKKAEEALRESEERFRIASQTASDVVYERDLRTGIATFYGDIDSHLGYEPGEYPRTMEGWRKHVHPEDLAWIDKQSIDQLKPGVSYAIEYRMRKKDGTYMTWLDRIMVIRDEETGKPLKFIGAATDITKRKQAEEALKESEGKYKGLFEHSNDSIFIIDRNGKIIDVNNKVCKMMGYTKEKLLQMSFMDFPTKDELRVNKKKFFEILEKGSIRFESKAMKQDGSIINVSISASIVDREKGIIQGIVHDITEKKQAEEELQKERDSLEIKVEERTRDLKKVQMEKMTQLYRFAEFGRLSSGLFHDLMSPLTGLSLNIEQIKNIQGKEMTETKSYLAKAITASKRMENFIIAIRKQMVGQENKTTFSLTKEIVQAIKILAYRARKTNVKVNFFPITKIQIYGDSIKFSQIVTNLITNAIDAYPKAGGQGFEKREVQIKLSEKDSIIYLSVEDWGCGIPKENIDRIFQPFFSTKDFKEGTGIGLSLIKSIVEKDFQGTVEVESEENKGAKFIIKFPKKYEKPTTDFLKTYKS